MKLFRLPSLAAILSFTILFFAISGIGSFKKEAYAIGESAKFVFAQLKYSGGNWNPRPRSGKRMVWELIKQTGVEAKLDTVVVMPGNDNIFKYPFVYMAGDREFDPFNETEIKNLRRFLEFGGTLLIDDCLGKPGIGFDKSVKREIGKLFSDRELEKLEANHTVFRSFFLLKGCAGRIDSNPYLHGITIDDRTVIIFSHNDLGGAWARDNFGNWDYGVIPGGMAQRKKAFHLGLNIIMYALTGNYKQDQVHLPFILRRQR